MPSRGLDAVFAPRAVALAGGSPKGDSVGRAVLRNLRSSGFSGRIDVVSPEHPELDGLATAPSFRDLPGPPDLVVVTAPPAAVPSIVDEAGEAGARAAVMITRRLGRGEGSIGAAVQEAAARRKVRLVGPGSLGVLSPHHGLNASLAPAANPGELALISQSGGLVAATIDWANARHVGFSGVAALGAMADVEVDDLLDYFALDRRTRAILLHVSDLRNAASFLSAARAAARIKPVVVVRSGRPSDDRRPTARTHAAALAGADAAYDAAFRRAGLLRVADLAELFSAAETLGRVAPMAGKRVAILGNGFALSALAAERLQALGGALARLSPETEERIFRDAAEGPGRGPTVDLRGDASPALYETALEAALDDGGVDAALVIHAPISVSPAAACAGAVVAATERARARRFPPKPVFAAFIGSDPEPRLTLEAAQVPFFRTPDAAVEGLMHLVRHVEAQSALLAAPPSTPEAFAPQPERARAALDSALARGREWLSPTDAAELLSAYAIPMLPQAMVSTPEEAAEVAGGLIGPSGATLKIVSSDIASRSAIGGVRLRLESPEAVESAARSMLSRVATQAPSARIEGFLVQPYVRPDDGVELFAGLADDPVFGPLVVVGAGGGGVELMRDAAVALPPLHLGLALETLGRTRVDALLDGYDARAPIDREAVALILVKLAQLASDFPELRELDLNPLMATPRGVIAFDARIRVAPAERSCRPGAANPRMAIRAYPKAYEQELALGHGGAVRVRPVRPEDEPAVAEFFRRADPEDLRQRFFTPMRSAPRGFIARLTQIDYARTMALLAFDPDEAVIGITQLHVDPEAGSGEFAILLRSDMKGRGLGIRLMKALIAFARAEGLKHVDGQVLSENGPMLAVCRLLGFEAHLDPDDPAVTTVTLDLAAAET